MSYDEFLDKFREKVVSPRQNGRRLYFYVRDEDLREIADYLFTGLGCRLSTSTGLETPEGFEVQHHFSDDRSGRYFCPTVKTGREKPAVTSIATVTKAASWIEREIHDFYGIEFRGHPDLRPLIGEDNERIKGCPLRQERKEQ